MIVAIVGAGQSGLTTAKTFIEKGIDIVVFEKSNSNGLFYNIKEKDYFKWSSSKYISSFSDFPIPKNYPIWMSINQFIQYLNAYKKKFNLDKYINYNTEVIKCIPKNNQWIITYRKHSFLYSITVDKLIITTGLNSTPKYPNLNNYSGAIFHGDDIYKMSKTEWKDNFNNKKILLLGGGESAFDVGHILVNNTKKLYFSTKNYIEWFPEWGYNKNEFKKCRKKNPAYFWYDYPSDTMLTYLEYSLPGPISGLWHNYGKVIFLGGTKKCSHTHFFLWDRGANTSKKLCNITKTPQSLFKKYVVKRTPFMCDINDNLVNIINYPIKYCGKNVITKKEIIKNVDIIICCTGYKKQFNFLDDKYYKCNLIKKIISTNNKNLAFIGFARPTMGSINSISEMQSWWTYLYFTNNLKYKIRNFKWGRPQDPLNIKNEHVNTIIIGNYYYRDLALDMNIHPNMKLLFLKNPKLWLQILFSSIHPTVFRLKGEFKHKNAKKFIYNLPSYKQQSKESGWVFYMFLFILLHIIFITFIVYLSKFLFKTLLNNKFSNIYKNVFTIFSIMYTYTYWY